MKKQKLNYRFHNPNTMEATADILLKVFVEANSEKVEMAIREVVKQLPEGEKCDVGHSAQ